MAVAAPPISLNRDEILRYSRHLILPEVGIELQLKLKNAKVLLVGAGGLGAPVRTSVPLGACARRRCARSDSFRYGDLFRKNAGAVSRVLVRVQKE